MIVRPDLVDLESGEANLRDIAGSGEVRGIVACG